MKQKNKSRLLIILGGLIVLILVVFGAVFAIPRLSSTSVPTVSALAISGLGDLPTITPPNLGEPTLVPGALGMRAAPTVTPSPIPLTPTFTPTPTSTPTPIPAVGQDDVPMIEVTAGEFLMGNTEEDIHGFLNTWYESYGLTYQPWTFLDETPRLRVYLDTFSIDQMEVTNGRYRQCIEAGYCPSVSPPDRSPPSRIEGYAADTAFDDYPVFTSWAGAYVYCQWVGKRLPTEAEWEKAARSTDGRQYPWGNEWDETRIERDLMPTGSNPQSASSYGVLGMVDNAPEWVLDRYALYPGIEQIVPSSPSVWNKRLAWDNRVIRGNGGNLFERRLTVRAFGNPNHALAGFRCVKGPEPIDLADAVQDILIPTPVPTIASIHELELSNMVYVPAGEFIMGTDAVPCENRCARHDDTMPAHIVYLDAYYIDRVEVTTEDYVAFLNVLNETLELPLSDLCGGESCATWGNSTWNYIIRQDGRFIVDDPKHMDYPVTGVSWYGADAYCRWLGKHLPTEAEWEKAARGTDGRLYPWGNDWRPGIALAGRDYEVGSEPRNAGPYGVLDMLDGVYEWTADYYAEDYYARSPAINPTGPSAGRLVVVRGSAREPEIGVIARSWENPSFRARGFRCAYRQGP
jgi:formylglycine-generating enzyme required for sulfatase activity